jgi:hypothetical protein
MLTVLILVAALESCLVTDGQAQSDHIPLPAPRNQENTYKGLRQAFLDRSQPGDARARRLHEMVMTDADQAFAIMPEALVDADPLVREEAAEWLAIRGDSRGLDAKMECIPDKECVRRFRDIERIGNSHRSSYAPPLARIVNDAIGRSWKDDHWSDQEDRLLVHDGIVALAKLGRHEDYELILRIASKDSSFRYYRALGYVDDERSRTLLWSALEAMSAQERYGGGHVELLLALSRLGDRRAITLFNEILFGKGSRRDRWLPNQFPELSAERSRAFESLRARDAINFAETTFAVAAQEPEGPGTREAWNALGVMHPRGYGKRLLALSLSRKPHWKTLAREVQLRVILATDPDPALVTLFFSSFVDVQQIPDESSDITIIRAGLGNLLFGGSWYWFGE